MFMRRITILAEIKNIINPKLVGSRRLFTTTHCLSEKLYAPPVVIKRQEIAKRELLPEDYYDNRPQEDNFLVSSLSQYLSYLHSDPNEDNASLKGIFKDLFQIGKKYYPRLKIDQDGYLMDPLQGPFKNCNDIVIIGGGLVGFSIAHHINRLFRGSLSVTVIENDYNQPPLATSYPMGKLKQQFKFESLRLLSKYGVEFLDNVKRELSFEDFVPDINLNYAGVLILANLKDDENVRKQSFLNRARGIRSDILTNAALQDKFPWIEVHDLSGAAMGLKQEGWYDDKKLLEALRLNCEYYGNTFLEGEIDGTDMDCEVNSWTGSMFLSKISDIRVKLSNGEIQSVPCGTVVLAAGTSSPNVAAKFEVGTSDDIYSPYSYRLPIEERVTYVTRFHAVNGPGINCPLVMDPSGVFFRRDDLDNGYICEWESSSGSKPLTNSTEIDKYFLDKIFPILCNRVKSFKKAEIEESIECPYDYNSFDSAPIVGFHPSVSNLFLSCGFRQNGFHALGVGNHLTDLLLGKRPKMDLDILKINRITREHLWKDS